MVTIQRLIVCACKLILLGTARKALEVGELFELPTGPRIFFVKNVLFASLNNTFEEFMVIAGVDEVGRGPMAGPLIAAAVIINDVIEGVKDSKLLTANKRKELAQTIKKKAICFAYGRAEVEEIHALNLHHATLLAMKRAIENLSIIPDKIIVDGIHTPEVIMPCYPIAKADNYVFEVSCASILAKVHRDDEMILMDEQFPGYGFASHKGYSTLMHQQALNELGPCAIHRLSYAPVAAALERFNSQKTSC